MTRDPGIGQTFHKSKPRLALIAALFAALTAFSAEGRAEYRTGPGDVIEILVLGVPVLQRKAAIEADGTITFPVIGTMPVGDLTLKELRAKIKSALGGSVVTIGANQDTLAVESSSVIVNIAAYRPVYVKGHVAKPGAYPYPGPIAVREAVALSGGYSLLRDLGEGPTLRAVDLKGDLGALWLGYANKRALIWRINAELGKANENPDAIAKSIPAIAPIERPLIDNIIARAASQLANRQVMAKREEKSLQDLITQFDKEIAIVSDQVKAEKKANAADVGDLKKLSELKKSGIINSQRFTDARRAVLFSSTRILQASARLNEATRQRSERQMQLLKFRFDRRSALYKELEAANVGLNRIQVKLPAANEKIALITKGLGLAANVGGRVATFIIHRRARAGIQHLRATEDFELMPGDTLDVMLGDNSAGQGGSVPSSN